MRVALGESGELDLAQTDALIAAIDEDREEIVAAARMTAEAERARLSRPDDDPPAVAGSTAEIASGEAPPPGESHSSSPREPSVEAVIAEDVNEEGTWLPVAGPVEEGDLLVLDPAGPGPLRLAASMADPHVIGIVAGPSRPTAGGGFEAPMAAERYAVVKADAGYGEIRPGDLLVSSPTPGHAMRALEVIPETVLGKAIDPLESGTGVIRLLLMAR
jgi:hypothetical protein